MKKSLEKVRPYWWSSSGGVPLSNGLETKGLNSHRRFERMLLPCRQTHGKWGFVG